MNETREHRGGMYVLTGRESEKLTEIFVLDVSSRFLFRLDDVVALLGHVLNEHFLLFDLQSASDSAVWLKWVK